MKRQIVCFGDSNTHGYCAQTGGRFDEGERWCCLLQESLGEGYHVVEEGLSGRTTCFPDPLYEGLSGLAYLTPCLMSHEPVDLLVIMLGTNDTKERFGASAACIGLGLKRLVDKARAVTECWREGKTNILVVTPQNIDRRYLETEVAATMGHGMCGKIGGTGGRICQGGGTVRLPLPGRKSGPHGFAQPDRLYASDPGGAQAAGGGTGPEDPKPVLSKYGCILGIAFDCIYKFPGKRLHMLLKPFTVQQNNTWPVILCFIY